MIDTTINQIPIGNANKVLTEAPKERRDAAEHRRRILAAARALFAAQGIDATNMTEIARAANLGQGTLYRRFAHKGELCEALLKENFGCFQNRLEERFTDQSIATVEHLDFLFRELIEFNKKNYPLLAAIIDAANGVRRGEYFQSPIYIWMHSTLVRLLQEGMAKGEFAEVDAEQGAHLVMATLKGTHFCQVHAETPYSTEQIATCLRALLIDGLRVRA
jgi:AcrR family transcriptional regulator